MIRRDGSALEYLESVVYWLPHSGLVGGGQAILGSNFFFVFLASYGLLTCIGVGENATYHLERPIRVPNPSLL